MTHYCENMHCEAEAIKRVRVSENRPGDSSRWLCGACEEVFTWGVQQGRMMAEMLARQEGKKKDRVIAALRQCLRRTCKTVRAAVEGVWDGNGAGWEAVLFDIERTFKHSLGKKGAARP